MLTRLAQKLRSAGFEACHPGLLASILVKSRRSPMNRTAIPI
jgi:hypothetical protein